MFAHRTATGLTLALLALPATATAQVQPNPDNRPVAVTTGQDLRSPDAIDAARGVRPSAHVLPRATATAQPAAPSNGPDWPPVAFGAAVLLVAAGGFAGTRVRARRVAA